MHNMNSVCDNIHKLKLHIHNCTVHNNIFSESTVWSFDRNHTADHCHDSTSVTVLTPNRANYGDLPYNSPTSKSFTKSELPPARAGHV